MQSGGLTLLSLSGLTERQLSVMIKEILHIIRMQFYQNRTELIFTNTKHTRPRHVDQGSKLTLAPSPEATGNRGGWVEYLHSHRSSAGRVDISIYFVSYVWLWMKQTTGIYLESQLKSLGLPIAKIILY